MRALLPFVCLLSLAAAPTAPDLTTEELGKLTDREIVVRADLSDPTGGSAMGIIDIAAPPERAFAAIVDLGARTSEISGLKSLSIYDKGETWISARWEVKIIASSAIFHIRYDLDPAHRYITYALDASQQPNDIVRTDGSYLLLPVGEGTRVIYRSSTDSGRSIPVFLKRWLASEALSQQLGGIRTRAERAP